MLLKKITREDILKEIEAERGSHIKFLQEFVRAKSPNPPGDTRAAARVITTYLSTHNIPFEILSLRDDLPNIVADFDCDFSFSFPSQTSSAFPNQSTKYRNEGKERRLVMNGHMDVFPVSEDDQGWQRDPWSGDVDEEFVYGRGVVDMKAGTAASIITYRYLYQLYQKQKQKQQLLFYNHQPQSQHPQPSLSTSSLALTIVSDEETGGKYGSKWLLSNENDGGKSRWKGTAMLNAEPGALQTIRFGEKGTLRLTFHIHTISAHGAYLNLSEGAIRIAARLITSLLSVEDIPYPNDSNEEFKKVRKWLERDEVKKVVNKVMGEGASEILMRPTVNVGVIAGGVGGKVNMIPGECEFQADIRIPIGMTRSIILDHINETILPKFPEAKMEIQEAASNPPNMCSMEHPLVDLLKKNAVFVGERKSKENFEGEVEEGKSEEGKLEGREKRGLTGFTPIEIPGMGGTDCKFWRYAGVPAYTYGPSPKTMASTNERVEIEEFLDVIKTHVLSSWEFLGGSDK